MSRLRLAFRYAWTRPVGGIGLYRARRTGLVLAARSPWPIHEEPFEAEPDSAELGALRRAVERLRLDRPEELAAFASEYGFLGVRHAHVDVTDLEPADTPVRRRPDPEPRRGRNPAPEELERVERAVEERRQARAAKAQRPRPERTVPPIAVEPVATAAWALLEYLRALELSASLASGDAGAFVVETPIGWRVRLALPDGLAPAVGEYPQHQLFRVEDGAALSLEVFPGPSERAAAEQGLAYVIASRRSTWEKADGFAGWVVTSPLGACWRGLGEELDEESLPLLCKRCGRPFLSRRRRAPPDYCSPTCRVEAWRARSAKSKSKAPRGRGR